jgi:hypothetical protein
MRCSAPVILKDCMESPLVRCFATVIDVFPDTTRPLLMTVKRLSTLSTRFGILGHTLPVNTKMTIELMATIPVVPIMPENQVSRFIFTSNRINL